jgi:hypothetical protein
MRTADTITGGYRTVGDKVVEEDALDSETNKFPRIVNTESLETDQVSDTKQFGKSLLFHHYIYK